MKILSAFAVALISANLFAVTHPFTWWVDAENYGKSGLDGQTEATAFGTIQDVFNLSDLSSTDTVKVKPGVYDKGETTDASGQKCRVYTNYKGMRVVSTGGKDVTFIVGRKLSAAEGGDAEGRGANAVRCVCRGPNCSGNLVIEGFTITDGATGTSSDNAGYGGGVLDVLTDYGLMVVDCVISNCTAVKGGGIRNGTLVRTLVTDCHSTSTGSAANGSQLYASIVAFNRGSYAALSTCQICNCTVVGNAGGGFVGDSCGIYNSVFDSNGGSEVSGSGNAKTGSVFTRTDGKLHVLAPGVNDFRLLSDSSAITAGQADRATKINKIGDYRYFDYFKQPIASSGSCTAGAVMEAVTPAGGCLKFTGRGVTVNGVKSLAGSWVYPTAYPTQYCVRAVLSSGEWLYALNRSDVVAVKYLFPQPDDSFWLMPPPDSSAIATFDVLTAPYASWVSPSGDDDNDGTQAHPYKTIQKAAEVARTHAPNRSVIFAAAGDYCEGESSSTGAGGSAKARVCLTDGSARVFIRGAGKGRSFITGAPDPDTAGFGPKAVRPISAWNYEAAIQGFTLRNGWSQSSGTYDGAGALSGRASDDKTQYTQVLDCEIAGCHGKDAIVYQCALTRCDFSGNASDGILVNTTPLFSTLFRDNNAFDTARSTLGTKDLVLANVTMFGKAAGQVFAGPCMVYGCIFVNGAGLGSTQDAAGNLCRDVKGVSGRTGFAAGDPAFAAAPSGDYHVRSSSLALTAMERPSAANYGTNYWKYATTDLDGKPLSFGAKGAVAGAYQTTVDALTWYVDAVNGDDQNTGLASDAAKKTLKAVMEAGVASGDTVHAAAGTYDSGVMLRDASVAMGSRVIVPAGATLVADAGAENTFIKGQDATTADVNDGCGSNAVRCVTLGFGAKIKGFTLMQGRTCCHPGGKGNVDNLGGGVTASVTDKPAQHVVEDCIITACNGYRAGGANHVRLVRCRVLDCRGLDSSGRAAGTYYCEHYNTYVDGCKPSYAVMYPKTFVSSTAGAANEGMGGPYLNAGNVCAPIVNSLICGPSQIANDTVLSYTYLAQAPQNASATWQGEGTVVTANLALDASGRPIIGSCDAVDGGSKSAYDAAICGQTDAAGGQRVYNGQIDAGAYEADWRNRYARDLTLSRKFSVTEARSGVFETTDGKVRIGEGESLTARWTGLGEDGMFTVSVRVEGAGLLTVRYGEDVRTVTSSSGNTTLKFEGCADGRELELSYAGDGTADVLSVKNMIGLAIFIR